MSNEKDRYCAYVGLLLLGLVVRLVAYLFDDTPRPVRLYRVRGTISQNGKPLGGVLISAYSNRDMPYLGMAVSDQNGEFEFFTAERPGVVAGGQRATAVQFVSGVSQPAKNRENPRDRVQDWAQDSSKTSKDKNRAGFMNVNPPTGNRAEFKAPTNGKMMGAAMAEAPNLGTQTNLLATRYEDPEKSGLEFEVEEHDENFVTFTITVE